MLLILTFGALTGLALGLTGGGGTMLALPFLMYGLGLPAHDAVAVSLVAVGIMAFVGALARLRAHQLQLHLGVLFAIAGMLGAPIGALVAHQLPAPVLTVGFAALTLIVAVRLWQRAYGPLPTDSAPLPDNALLRHAACRFDPTGKLRLTSHCLRLLIPTGFATGIISGLFGVGGGFVVVPALVLIAGIDIRQATATSLLVVALVSLSGAAGAFAGGVRVDPLLIAGFAGAGVLGLEIGSRFGRRLPERVIQRGFSVALVLVAAALILIPLIQTFSSTHPGGVP
jgi:uncharacterized membrane protein YfcA